MPVTPTYPGVYVEEIPSGVRTITGVATSITAFIGRAKWGPVNEPVPIFNYGDFERTFGGLGVDYPMSYSVRDFFLNGGAQAVIVRLFNDPGDEARAAAGQVADAATGADAGAAAEAARGAADDINADQNAGDQAKAAADNVATAAENAAAVAGSTPVSVQAAAKAAANKFNVTKKITLDTLSLKAASPGAWGNSMRVRYDPDDVSPAVAERLGVAEEDLFKLTVENVVTGASETFLNLTVVDTARRIDRVLEAGSNLVRWAGDDLDSQELPDLPADQQSDPISEKEDDLEEKEKILMDLKLNGVTGQPLDDAQQDVADAKAALKEAQTADMVSDGQPLEPTTYAGSLDEKSGLYALEKVDLFNLLCIPPDFRRGNTHPVVYQTALLYCYGRRAMLIVDPPKEWSANKETAAQTAKDGLDELGLSVIAARNAALYFPRVTQADPLRDGQLDTFVPCGLLAGIMARTDVRRGVWKAPAGIDDGGINGIQGLEVKLTNEENGLLNPVGINCLRTFPLLGRVVWGARTLRGADQLADEYKYIPVRRLALFIEESLYRGLQWVVFEPNDEPLWAQIRLNVGAFMQNLFRQGAFQGTSPREAYFVKCDKETTTQNDINLGIVNIHVGFAPLKPAEFVIIKLQQIAGQVEV